MSIKNLLRAPQDPRDHAAHELASGNVLLLMFVFAATAGKGVEEILTPVEYHVRYTEWLNHRVNIVGTCLRQANPGLTWENDDVRALIESRSATPPPTLTKAVRFFEKTAPIWGDQQQTLVNKGVCATVLPSSRDPK